MVMYFVLVGKILCTVWCKNRYMETYQHPMLKNANAMKCLNELTLSYS